MLVRTRTWRDEGTGPNRDTIRPDTVFVPSTGSRVNRLTNDALDPSSRMPEFKVCAAELLV
ncbi:molybdopterin dinucleotide binding domain-containing protein [Nocardioides kongjuensis]|uniref:molybdopterin dinucleotide binding domain-containing protein n=1 Tax=Nocardioides kongjuensis TaxID=349522 RepID=UPI0031EBC57F